MNRESHPEIFMGATLAHYRRELARAEARALEQWARYADSLYLPDDAMDHADPMQRRGWFGGTRP